MALSRLAVLPSPRYAVTRDVPLSALIRPVLASETRPIRWDVLRPGFPAESAVFEGDTNAGTFHLGAFLNQRLVGVASLFEVPFPERPGLALQLRGMATLPEVRGKGCGKRLLHACIEIALQRSVPLLWCNARETAVGFYCKQGWQVVGARFEIPTVGPHFRMFLELNARDQGT